MKNDSTKNNPPFLGCVQKLAIISYPVLKSH